jgi:serine/threonine-protein kinase RsbW
MPTGPEIDAANGTAHLVIAGDPMSVRQGLLSLSATVPLCLMSADDRGTAELVLGEVLNNIVEHAYPHAPGLIELMLARTDAGLICQIIDSGLAMQGGKAPVGNLPAAKDGPLADLPEGGFGWFLIRSLTKDLRYERKDRQNHLRFTLASGASVP